MATGVTGQPLSCSHSRPLGRTRGCLLVRPRAPGLKRWGRAWVGAGCSPIWVSTADRQAGRAARAGRAGSPRDPQASSLVMLNLSLQNTGWDGNLRLKWLFSTNSTCSRLRPQEGGRCPPPAPRRPPAQDVWALPQSPTQKGLGNY